MKEMTSTRLRGWLDFLAPLPLVGADISESGAYLRLGGWEEKMGYKSTYLENLGIRTIFVRQRAGWF